MEINSNKAGIARSLEENRAQAKALQAKDVQTSPVTAKPELKEGQQVKGTVLDLRYNEVKLQLEPGKQVVTARISGEIPLAIGEEARFQVTEDNANHLILKYLPEDTAPVDTTILKALTASGLPLTDRNKAILSELLKYRMPIDKQTLQTLIKAAVTNREASPQSLVLMLKNNIPLTASNIRQFEAYRNGAGQLLTDIQNMTKSLSELLTRTDGSSATCNPASQLLSMQEAADSASASVSVLPQSTNRTADQSQAQNVSTQTGQFLPQTGLPLEAPASPFQQVLSINNSLIQILLKNSETASQSGASALDAARIAKQVMNPEAILSGETEVRDTINVLAKENTVSADALPRLSAFLAEGEQANLGRLLAELPEGASFVPRLAEGSASVTDIMKFIAGQLPQASEQSATTLLQSPEYAKLLTEAFHERWTITPDKLEQKGSVSDLYRKLQDDTEAISLLSRSEAKALESLKLQEPVKGLQENLQFMKDLNQMFTYLQLPIQLKDQDIHSELYVFTDKKALKTKKNLSVLLHLDLPNLGALNIHITMEHNQVYAKFYTETKEAKALLTDNVTSLTDALKKKGYAFRGEVMDAYEKPDFVKDFIEQNAEESSPTRYSFDIRA